MLALTSSSNPVVLLLQTPGGVVTFRAQSFQYDLHQNVLHATGAVLIDPNGERLIEIDDLLLRDLLPGKKTITGYAKGITGKIERDPDRKWKFLDYLPQQEGEPSDIAFALELEDLSVKVIDRAAKTPFSRWVSSTAVHIDGVGDDLVVTGPIKLEGSGTTNLAFRKRKDGLYVSGSGRMELAPVLDWLKGAPEGRDIEWLPEVSIGRLTTDGDWTVTYIDEIFAMQVPGRATYQDMRFGEYYSRSGAVQGTITETSFDGFATAENAGARARFEGRVRWDKEVQMAGRAEGNIASLASLPPSARGSVPKGAAFSNARFAGWLSYKKDITFFGSAEADMVRYEGEEFRGVKAKLDVTPAMATVGIADARYQGQPVTGAIQIAPQTTRLSGFVTAKRLLLEPLLKRFGVEGLRGQGTVTATLSGTTAKPLVAFSANGQARSSISGPTLDLGDFSVRGSYANSIITLDRSGIRGPSGSAYAKGTLNLASSKLDLDVLASDFPLQAVSAEVEGAATFRGIVRGTFSNPVAEGGAEIYNLRIAGQDIPVGFADIVANNQSLTANNVVAIRGGSRVQGEAGIRWKDQSLFGNLDAYGIQANDWFPDQIAGILDVRNATVGGTLTAPTLSASVTGSNLVVPGLKLDEIRASIAYEGGTLKVTEGQAKVGEGTIAAAGDMDLSTRSGTFALDVKDLPLARLLFDAAKQFNVSGTASGSGTVALVNGDLGAIATKGQVQNLSLNETVIGSGQVVANYDGGIWSGNALVGQVESYLEIPKFSLNPATEEIDAEIILNNEPLSKLVTLAKQYAGASISENMALHLDRLEGEIDFSGRASGKWTNPTIESQAFLLSEITIDGVDLGQIDSKFQRANGVWNLENVTWNGPQILVQPTATKPPPVTVSPVVAAASTAVAQFNPAAAAVQQVEATAQEQTIQAKFTASGSIDEHGDTKITGSLNNLLARSLSAFVPGIAGLDGIFDMPFFQVSGPTKSPLIDASLGYHEGIANRDDSRSIDITASVKEGLIEAQGLYQFIGFTGPIEAKIPFNYPFAIAQTEEIFAKISLPERKLTDLLGLWPTLDVSRTAGAVQGEITVTGKPDALKFQGSARLFPEPGKPVQVADTKLATQITDLDASVIFDGERLTVAANGKSSDSGTFAIRDVSVGLGDVFGAVLAGDTDKFFGNALTGRLDFDRFKLTYRDKSAGNITSTLSGGIDLRGSVGQPMISGELIVDEGNLAVPTLQGTGESGEFSINPNFDLAIRTGQPIRFRAGTGQFDLTGTGAIKGSLETPDVNAVLVTRAGSIRLPNARIAIEEGGEIRVTYRTTPTGIVASRADLNLKGRTQVTAERFSGGGVERYDVELDITGNILDDQGMVLKATSDPPDLSQDRILALLGQGDFLRTISINALSPTEQLRSALVGLALPYLAGSITDKIAASLGLDYINVEYSSFDRVTITAAISLTRDLVLSGRRQISSPLPGERPKYDIRLSYRPRFNGKSFSRLSFSLGVDQDRPWKIGVEYAIKY